MREKARLEPRYAELVYDGLWFSPLREALDAFVESSQRHVTGEVRLRLEPGRCEVVGRRADAASTTTSSRRTTPRTRSVTRMPPGSCGSGASAWRPSRAVRGHRSIATARVRPMSEAPDADGQGTGRTLWHGRFSEAPSDELLVFTESLSFDRRLASDDVEGSRAHVAMLGEVGLLDADEVGAVLGALDRVEEELTSGAFEFVPTDEDVHTAIERRVTELAGAAGAKIHTARSRNDQVATDLRLWLRREGRSVARRTHALQALLFERATAAGTDVYLPGYTHLQRAQPVLLAHHLLAHAWALARDVDRWRDALDRADVSPLGGGRPAGTSLPIAPDVAAAGLGFARPFENSLDAVSDRDFVAEALFVAALEQVHLSRLGEEIVLWASDEFGFLHLADAHSTGSSMLPQKKNPDIAELARGRPAA